MRFAYILNGVKKKKTNHPNETWNIFMCVRFGRFYQDSCADNKFLSTYFFPFSFFLSFKYIFLCVFITLLIEEKQTNQFKLPLEVFLPCECVLRWIAESVLMYGEPLCKNSFWSEIVNLFLEKKRIYGNRGERETSKIRFIYTFLASLATDAYFFYLCLTIERKKTGILGVCPCGCHIRKEEKKNKQNK